MFKKLILKFNKKTVFKETDRLREKLQGIPIEYEIPYHVEAGKEALVISDSQEVCDWCVEHNIAIIAYLEEENKQGDFFKVKYAIEDFEGIDYCYLNRIYQRYHGIPWHILETERCIVREISVEDVDDLYLIYSDSSITLFLEKLFREKEKEEEYIANYIEYIYHFFEYGMWVIEEKRERKLIGRAGIEWKKGGEKLELGYVIAKPYQEKGIAYEVCSAIITYVRENVTSQPIYLQTEAANTASVKLAEKLGFHLEKMGKDNGKLVKSYILRD